MQANVFGIWYPAWQFELNPSTFDAFGMSVISEGIRRSPTCNTSRYQYASSSAAFWRWWTWQVTVFHIHFSLFIVRLLLSPDNKQSNKLARTNDKNVYITEILFIDLSTRRIRAFGVQIRIHNRKYFIITAHQSNIFSIWKTIKWATIEFGWALIKSQADGRSLYIWHHIFECEPICIDQ